MGCHCTRMKAEMFTPFLTYLQGDVLGRLFLCPCNRIIRLKRIKAKLYPTIRRWRLETMLRIAIKQSHHNQRISNQYTFRVDCLYAYSLLDFISTSTPYFFLYKSYKYLITLWQLEIVTQGLPTGTIQTCKDASAARMTWPITKAPARTASQIAH